MVRWFEIGNENNTALIAGILISSFSLSEAITGMYWGSLSDRVGRKPVLLFGCFGTMISMLMLGCATSFWVALLARSLGGILNGNIGVIQTMVGELVKNPAHEGLFDQAGIPQNEKKNTTLTSFPSTSLCGHAFCMVRRSADWSWDCGLDVQLPLFPSLPYLLPNLICAGMLLISIVVGYFFLEETKDQTVAWNDKDASAPLIDTPLVPASGTADGVDLRNDVYGTFNHVEVRKDQSWNVNPDGSSRPPSITSQGYERVFTKRVLMPIVALGLFCYHSMCYDHLLPIFLQDDRASDVSNVTLINAGDSSSLDIRGGLGLSTQQVGIIMSVNGLVALFIQGIIFPIVADWLGVWRLFQLITLFHPIVYFVVPFVAMLHGSQIFAGIYASLALRNFFAILAYPLILILIKEACNPKHLGKINGLGASVGAVARCISPPISGLLYDWGKDFGFTGFAWWAAGLVAVGGAIQLFWIRREKDKIAIVRLPCTMPSEHDPQEVVHIHVVDEEV